MSSANIEELRKNLEECDDICLNLGAISSDNLRKFEQPLRKLERLLEEARGQEGLELDYIYFSIRYYEMNADLYRASGQMQKMRECFLKGKASLDLLEKYVPYGGSPVSLPDRTKIMFYNGACFAQYASLQFEITDMETAWELAVQAARIFDWIWPELLEERSIYAADSHLKLASLSIMLQNDEKECERQLACVKEKYYEIYLRTGKDEYLEKSKNTALGVPNGTEGLSEEMLNGNPALAVLVRTAQYTDMGCRAVDDQDDGQAAFYFDKAAIEAEKLITIFDTPAAHRTAAIAFFFAADCQKETDLQRAKELAEKALHFLALTEAEGDPVFSAKDLRLMKKELEPIVNGRKASLWNRIFGK